MFAKLLRSPALTAALVYFCMFMSFIVPMSSFGYNTQNAIVIVIDGARYTETFGDSSHQYIPMIWNDLRHRATIYTRFYNDSMTVTCPGHANIATGTWQNLSNGGGVLPQTPTMFEYFRKELGTPKDKNFVILGKPKLDIIACSDYTGYGPEYGASVIYCNNYSMDVLTWENIRYVLSTFHPRLAVANLGQVDYMGHSSNYGNYCTSIRQADSIVALVWNYLQADPFYKDKTTLFVTNDHGRHTTEFSSHGDGCDGCRHLMCLMIGPDTRAGVIDSTYRQQIDITPTIGDLLNFSTPFAAGHSLVKSSFAPEAPALVLPSNGAIDLPHTITLQWKQADGSLSYRIQAAETADFLHPVVDDSNLTVPLKTISHLSNGKVYYWRVNASNTSGTGAWSEVRFFKVLSPEVVLLQPQNEATVSVDTVSLVWNVSMPNVDRYWIEIATDSLMEKIVLKNTSVSKTSMLYCISQNKTIFWWRVRANTPQGWANWSDQKTFSSNIPEFHPKPEINACSFNKVGRTGNFFTVSYALRDPSPVAITITTLQGRILNSFYESFQLPDYYTRRFDLSAFSGGCYIITFKTPAFSKNIVATILQR